jgi:hypothetical protein
LAVGLLGSDDMKTLTLVALVSGALVLGLVVAPASAVTFTFNSLADGAPDSGGVLPTDSIQNYMQSLLPGTTITGAIASNSYTGDGHVVGPVTKSGVTPITLGTSDGAIGNNTDLPHGGANDTFIVTNNTAGESQITVNFLHPVSLVSFDWEIFPDGTCPSLSSCGAGNSNLPDLTFKINGVQIFNYHGVTPGSSPFGQDGVLGNTYTHSPFSGSGASEAAPQLIGHDGVGASNVTKLEFIDWPERIGIDNLIVTPPGGGGGGGQVPQPSAVVLYLVGLLAIWVGRSRTMHVANLAWRCLAR